MILDVNPFSYIIEMILPKNMEVYHSLMRGRTWTYTWLTGSLLVTVQP